MSSTTSESGLVCAFSWRDEACEGASNPCACAPLLGCCCGEAPFCAGEGGALDEGVYVVVVLLHFGGSRSTA